MAGTLPGFQAKIARDWNTKSEARAGFVTRFSVDDAYASRFELRAAVVGSREHEELRVPAEELAEFNAHLEGRIEVIGAHLGEGFAGEVPEHGALKGKDATAQLVALVKTLAYSSFDVAGEVAANHQAVFLNFFFWEQRDFAAEGSAPRRGTSCSTSSGGTGRGRASRWASRRTREGSGVRTSSTGA